MRAKKIIERRNSRLQAMGKVTWTEVEERTIVEKWEQPAVEFGAIESFSDTAPVLHTSSWERVAGLRYQPFSEYDLQLIPVQKSDKAAVSVRVEEKNALVYWQNERTEGHLLGFGVPFKAPHSAYVEFEGPQALPFTGQPRLRYIHENSGGNASWGAAWEPLRKNLSFTLAFEM